MLSPDPREVPTLWKVTAFGLFFSDNQTAISHSGVIPRFCPPLCLFLDWHGVVIAHESLERLCICSGFLLMNLFFKIGQNYKYAFAAQVPKWFGGIPLMENTGPFFLRGTFDVNDIFAMIAGAAAAFAISELLIRQQRKRKRDGEVGSGSS